MKGQQMRKVQLRQRQTRKKKGRSSVTMQIMGAAAKPAQLQHLLHRTSTQNVRYVTIGTRPGEANRHRRQRFKHLRAFSPLRSSHHDLELMPNLHPGTEHAVSIQGTGNWWPKESQQEPWHTETTTGGAILHQNGIIVNWFADIIKQ